MLKIQEVLYVTIYRRPILIEIHVSYTLARWKQMRNQLKFVFITTFWFIPLMKAPVTVKNGEMLTIFGGAWRLIGRWKTNEDLQEKKW